MDRPQPQKGRVDIDLNHDYISNLPAVLKEKILVKLSIKEAVRTSILSSKWKDSWTSLPELVFNEKSTESRLINLVDLVLLVHRGQIRIFKLFSQHACNLAISRWMLVLSTNGIEFIDLAFKADNVDYRKLRAAKDGKGSNIIRAIGCISNIKKLNICGGFLDYLAMGSIPENLAVFNHLTDIYVQLGIYLDEIVTALCLFQNAPNLEVLRIEFQGSKDQLHVQALWGSKAIRDCLFNHLEVVDIMFAHGTGLSLECFKSMLDFSKLVLSTAPLLKKLNVIGLEDAREIFEMLEFFPRLSKKAIVFIKG